MPKLKWVWGEHNGRKYVKTDVDSGLRCAAVHESAHAVVAHVFGVTVNQILLIHKRRPFETWWGNTEVQHVGGQDVIAHLCISLAGHEAEVLEFGRPVDAISLSDWKHCLKAGVVPHSKGEYVARYLARQTVVLNFNLVRRVAAVLERQLCLTASEFYAIAGSRLEPSSPTTPPTTLRESLTLGGTCGTKTTSLSRPSDSETSTRPGRQRSKPQRS